MRTRFMLPTIIRCVSNMRLSRSSSWPKTVKGYGMGDAGEGQNITHQTEKTERRAVALGNSGTASTSPSPTKTSPERFPSTNRPRTARDSSTCTRAAQGAGWLSPGAAPRIADPSRYRNSTPFQNSASRWRYRRTRSLHDHGFRTHC